MIALCVPEVGTASSRSSRNSRLAEDSCCMNSHRLTQRLSRFAPVVQLLRRSRSKSLIEGSKLQPRRRSGHVVLELPRWRGTILLQRHLEDGKDSLHGSEVRSVRRQVAFTSKELAGATVVGREAAGGKLQLLKANEGQKDEAGSSPRGVIGASCRAQSNGISARWNHTTRNAFAAPLQ